VAVEQAGVFAMVLEGIPAELARAITERTSIPTIGIGAGVDCDGQVLVMHDVLGLSDSFLLRFARPLRMCGKMRRSRPAPISAKYANAPSPRLRIAMVLRELDPREPDKHG